VEAHKLNRTPAPVAPNYTIPTGLRRNEFAAMGTTVAVFLPETVAEEGTDVVQTLFATWEETFSRFRSTSELTRLNERAGLWTSVSDVFYFVLEQAIAAAHVSDGLFDPALNIQMNAIGYTISFHDMHGDSIESGLLNTPGGLWQSIQINPQTHQVLIPEGIGLDFGGIAKGMAVDAAILALSELDVTTALVNAGGDLRVIGVPPQESSWSVAIPSHDTPVNIALSRGALATSSTVKRRWTQGGQPRHHLIDPRSGFPATTDVWSVTVAAELCQQAEVAAKVALILGSIEGRDWLEYHQLAAVLLTNSGERIITGDWPTDS